MWDCLYPLVSLNNIEIFLVCSNYSIYARDNMDCTDFTVLLTHTILIYDLNRFTNTELTYKTVQTLLEQSSVI